MITSKQIRNLANLKSGDRLVSSLYLRLWPDSRVHRTRVKDLIREKRETLGDLSDEERRFVEGDLQKMRDFIETFRDSPYKGIVVFACGAQEVWEVFSLTQPVTDLLVIDYSAFLRPLTGIINQYRSACTLLVDRSRARIFELSLGKIEEHSEIFTEAPSKVREAGWYGLNEKKIARHAEQHLHDHLKKVAALTFDHFQQNGFDWLLLGGHEEVLAEMENTLHSYLRQRLKRTFRIDHLELHPDQILDKTLELMRDIKREEDRALVSRLTNSLKPSGLGVAGIHETLSSLYIGSVQTLLLEEGFSQSGALCLKCGFMGLTNGSCPMCSEAMTSVPDIVDEAVSMAIHQNSEVFHITPESQLKALGSIGALLRYAVVKPKEIQE